MNIEFHYYITQILARRAGFSEEESYLIAYSSQYVDDNSLILTIDEEKDGEYKNYISQTINILRPKPKLMRIYPCFHFVPGEYECEEAKRKDGKMHILNTTPNNKRANKLLEEALATGDPYRIGIATHSYADTWAHQNFTGYFDYFNGMGGILEKVSPNIGHADAHHSPDIPSLVWKDERLISHNALVRNKERFLDAARHIYLHYKAALSPETTSPDELEQGWGIVAADLAWAMGREFEGKDRDRKKRMAHYKSLLGDFTDYDDDDWLLEGIRIDVSGLPDHKRFELLANFNPLQDKYYKKHNFENSHWYKFQEAVKEHQKLAESLMEDLFCQMEVEEY
ncbi:MAG: DUF6765 family protein [bacterium]